MFLLNQTTHRMIMRHDPQIGHMWVPNQCARIPHEGGGYRVRTNAAGFRSDTEFTETRKDLPRVLFFGDSMTAGDGCSNSHRFSDRLAHSMGIETFNYGLSGSGTDQQLLILKEYAQNVEADLVVLCVYVENIQRNMLSGRPTIDRDTGKTVTVPKPYFTLNGETLELKNTPVPLDRMPSPGSTDAVGKVSVFHEILSKTAASAREIPFLRKTMQKFFSPKASDYTHFRSILPQLTGYQPTPEYDDMTGEPCRLLKAIIRTFHDACGDIPLLILPIPTSDHILGRAKPNFMQFFNELACPDEGLFVADLHSFFQQHSLDVRRRIPFDYDTHFSPFGHRLTAQFLQDQIAQRGLIRQAPAPMAKPAKSKGNYILGISCFYHNSAACLIHNGEIFAAAEEERFTRIKQDRRFPSQATNYCLEEAGIDIADLSSVVFYDDPHLTFERLMATIAEAGPNGHDQWMRMMPTWACYKLRIPELIRQELHYDGPILKTLHHRSHAASAFFPSRFKSAAILTVDGVGEWTTASIGRGDGNTIELLKEMRFPHSIGLLYSAFTQFLGFKVNSGEYKMMGLAPYGEPIYKDLILEHLVTLNDDGAITLKMDKFAFLSNAHMAGSAFEELFGPARQPESAITARDLNLARSIQVVTEEALLRMARTAHELTGEKRLCMAGGVALNCVANGRILREGPFDEIWIQPAAGDAGGALGAALDVWHSHLDQPRMPATNTQDAQKASLLGPAYSDDEILAFLESRGIPFQKLSDAERADTVAALAVQGKVIGHFAGRSEYGPRALGSRSIIGDPRNEEMQSTLNLKIKYRESFRPFAPIVLEEMVSEYFELDRPSPYMLIVAPVLAKRRLPFTIDATKDVHDQVRTPRSDIPAITHVDYSARVQSVGKESNRALREVMLAFKQQTGYGIMVNTSFNVRGEPIVNTPQEAYRCFMNTEMDVLVLENFLLLKEGQPRYPEETPRTPPPSTHFDDAFTEQLDALFTHSFLPKLSEAAKEYSLASTQPAGWMDWQPPRNGKRPISFAIENMTEDQLATAIVADWDSRTFAEAMQPCINEIITIGRKHIRDSELIEEVSEQMYVMF